jgi:hypothetical protein
MMLDHLSVHGDFHCSFQSQIVIFRDCSSSAAVDLGKGAGSAMVARLVLEALYRVELRALSFVTNAM